MSFSRGSKLVLALMIVALLSGASMTHLMFTSHATTISYRIRGLEDRKLDLLSEKSELLFEIAEDTDLVILQQRASELDFVPARKVEYLSVAVPTSRTSVADSSASVPGEDVHQSPAQDTQVGGERSETPGWWDRLMDQFAIWATVEPEVTPTPIPGQGTR